jgi:hypothetical protein
MEKFKNIHNGEDIYVIAAGKSVDFIDKSFFDNKILIGVNLTYKYVMPKYLVRKEHLNIDYAINNTTQDVIHFISKGNCGGLVKFIEDKYKNRDNIIIYNHDRNIHDLIKLPEDDKLVVSFSTITTAIHLAAYMGAKNIILVGHDCGTINGESNFKTYYDNVPKPSAEFNYNEWLKQISSQTESLKKLLKDKYNCNVLSLNPFVNFRMEGNIFN